MYLQYSCIRNEDMKIEASARAVPIQQNSNLLVVKTSTSNVVIMEGVKTRTIFSP